MENKGEIWGRGTPKIKLLAGGTPEIKLRGGIPWKFHAGGGLQGVGEEIKLQGEGAPPQKLNCGGGGGGAYGGA